MIPRERERGEREREREREAMLSAVWFRGRKNQREIRAVVIF